MSADNSEIARTVQDQLAQAGVSVPLDEVTAALEDLEGFSLPTQEKKRTVISNFTPSDTNAEDVMYGSSSPEPLPDVVTPDNEDTFFTCHVRVEELWDPRSPSIGYVGLVVDSTGTREKFVVFEDSDVFEDLSGLEEGDFVEMEGVVVDVYQGNASIKAVGTSTISPLDEDDQFEVPDSEVEITGVVTEVRDNSGLIQRCPVDTSEDDEEESPCGNTLQDDGHCQTHGSVTGEDDLRLIMYLNTGGSATKVVVPTDPTVDLTGIDLEEALTIARDEMDREAVLREMRNVVSGSLLTVTGEELDGDDEETTVYGTEIVDSTADGVAPDAVADTVARIVNLTHA